jgi:1,4-dihydroxy-6-naphthoate synthase
VRHNYRLLACGASVGDGYGPIVVSKRPLSVQDLDEVTVAVPGQMTTSFLALKLFSPGARTRIVPFDRIMDEVERGNADAGLVIHEGQLTWSKHQLHRVIDLGEWWTRETGLPLPLGGNGIRRSIDPATAGKIADSFHDSIAYALDHRAEALDHAMRFARGLDRTMADRFVGMYVNDFTLELGKRGEDAVALLLRLGHEAGLIPELVEPEFIG